MDEGSNDLTVKAVDVAGNETTITQNVTVDTSVSSLTADITDATNSGSNDDSITNNATPTIAGQTEAGAIVTIMYTDVSGTSQRATGTADENGVYSITLDDGLPEGTNSLNIKAIDAAGNETKIMHDVTIDNSVGSPAISIAGDTNEDGVYNAEELGENGTVTATVSLPDDFDAETDTLTINGETYSLSAGEIAAGEVTVELEPEATIKATITDAAGNTSSEATATALAANEAPVAEAKNDSVDEDSRITGSITANDADLPSTANLTFSTTAIVAGLMLNSNGTYAFDASSYDSLKDGEELELEIPITVTDDKGATDTTTLTITVTGTNDVPTATAKVDSVTENHTITGTISANDVDLADGAALSFSTTSDVAGLTLKSDGSYSFDASSYDSLAAGEKQLVEVPVTVTDDKGATTETTLTITVTGTNDAPVATDDSTMTYDTGIRLDELPEYGTMQVQNTDGNWVEMTVGVTYGSDSEVRFIPDDNIDDSIEFTVGSIDSNPSTSSFDGTASVSDWGDLVDGKAVKSFDSNEDGTPELTVTTSVSSGDLTAVNGKSHQGHGIGNDNHSGLSGDEFLRVDIDSSNIAINKISFTLDGLGGYFDGGHSNSTKVSITAYTSDGEEISTDGGYRQNGNYEETYTFITDQAVDYFVLTTTGGTGTYVVQNMTVSQAVSDEVTLTTLQADGSETTTGVIFDPSDVSEDGTVSLTSKFADLLDSDLTEGAIATDEDASITIDVLANDTDVDGTIDPTSVVITTQPEHGTVSVNSETGKVTYTPNEHYNGNDSFEYTVEDDTGLVSNAAKVSLTVNSVDDATVIVDDSASTNEDVSISKDAANGVLANDSDEESDLSVVSFSVGEQSSVAGSSISIVGVGVLLVNADGSYSFEAVKDWSGDVPNITYTTNTDAKGNLSLTVNPVADTPSLVVNIGEGASEVVTTKHNGLNISQLGSDGDNFIDSAVVTTDTVNRTLNFGVENAGKVITLSFDTQVQGSWDNATGYTKDTYSIKANGSTLATFDYNRTFESESFSSNQSNSYQVTLDGQGKASVDFLVASTQTTEIVNVSNISGTLVSTNSITYPLDITGTNNDSDGSETLSYEIGALPEGATLLDADGNPIASNEATGHYDLSETQVSGLQLSVKSDVDPFDLTVSVRSQDGDSVSAPVSTTITIEQPDSTEEAPTFFEGVSRSLESDLEGFESSTDNSITGTSNNDFLTGADGNDHIRSFNAQDIIAGGAGSDWLEGGEGDDILYGNGYYYTVDGDSDRLDGGAGKDTLYGSVGDDFLLGGAGDDTLYGGVGDDVLIGGGGQDRMVGGDGRDLFVLDKDDNSSTVIADFQIDEDALDISDLLDIPTTTSDIQSYLNDKVSVTTDATGISGLSVKDSNDADHQVATFGSGSALGSSGTSVTVVFNDQEYSINVDG
ncbi:tandem-95 repeat protein [Marinomonas arenicola]|uniref:tandem-95 repeat protein n=1 Tax=Marinomonas arenicola TaxID=569601 RepID=UPI00311EAFCD